jgi:tRNA A-37 threonylcarbamoyl transferase component Bud32
VSTCPTCTTPLPSDALYCPRCGASTPTQISRETGATAFAIPAPSDAEAVSTRRAELQCALGTGFEVKELIGQGGFGEVWAVADVKLKRDVAVKLLRQDLVASQALLERFRREAGAAANLRHPNIVPIYQVGEAQGLVYFVMPLIKGESLRAVMEREGRLDVAEAVRILTDVASALHEAHHAGIVHRDIKPDNILLEGSQRRVLLMDFGIAKSLEAQESSLTGTGIVMGTPQYMSPEQALGAKLIDARSDLYSLGVVAYQMLAGRLPFEADSAQGMIVAHIMTPPDPIDTAQTGVPEEMAAVVMRALAKKPDERWGSAAQFADAMRLRVPVSIKSTLHGHEAAAAAAQESRSGETVKHARGAPTKAASGDTEQLTTQRTVRPAAEAPSPVTVRVLEVPNEPSLLTPLGWVTAIALVILAAVGLIWVLAQPPTSAVPAAVPAAAPSTAQAESFDPLAALRAVRARRAQRALGTPTFLETVTPRTAPEDRWAAPTVEGSDLDLTRPFTPLPPPSEPEPRVPRPISELVNLLRSGVTENRLRRQTTERFCVQGDLTPAVRQQLTQAGASGEFIAFLSANRCVAELACTGTPQLGCGLARDQFSQIPAGTFQMGSAAGYSNEQPVHSVTISGFYMQKTEVTQGQWRAVMGSNPSYFPTCGDTCPVETVSWNEIQTFLTTLNAQTPGVTYRLPTEAEWEYAARAGTTGETYGTRDAIAWYDGNSASRTHAAAGKQANAWGLYDMLGNVSEWVNDWYGSFSSASVTDPTGPATGTSRVLRGGSWLNDFYNARAANRGRHVPSLRINGYGFRLVRTP